MALWVEDCGKFTKTHDVGLCLGISDDDIVERCRAGKIIKGYSLSHIGANEYQHPKTRRWRKCRGMTPSDMRYYRWLARQDAIYQASFRNKGGK